MEDCHGCIGAIRGHRENYLTTIKQARELAKETQTIIIIYRTTDGNITLTDTGEIDRYISPYM